jgi:hypothetical protein
MFGRRSTGGCLLALATVDLVRTAAHVRLLVVAICVGAIVSALTGVAEIGAASMASWLMPFKTQPTFASGFLRASGTFQYANTAAMFWEGALPLLVGLAVVRAARGPGHAGAGVWLAAAGVVGAAIVASASRAGLVTAVITLLLLLGPGGRRVPGIRRAAVFALALLVISVIGHGLQTGLLVLRVRTADASQWHRAEWRQTPPRLDVVQGQLTRVRLRLRNSGVLAWTATGSQPVYVSYHWMRGQDYLVFEGARTRLPHDVRPGSEVVVDAFLHANVGPGVHALQWDLVRDGVTWFSAEGGPVAESRVTVRPAEGPPVAPPDLDRIQLQPQIRPPRTQLWLAAWRMWRQSPWTGIGADNFRHVYGRYVGLVPFDDRITANSMVLEILATTGLVGALAWGWLTIRLGRHAWGWWRIRPPREDDALVIAVGAGALAFAIHGAVDYFLEFTPTYGLFWLLIGLSARAWRLSTDPPAERHTGANAA